MTTEKILSASAILLAAFLLRYNSPLQAEEEMIVPDGLEYALGGLELLHGRIPLLKIDGEVYPPRFFLGYSLLTVPFYRLFGEQLGNAIFASLFFGLCSLFLLYVISKKLFGHRAALFSLVMMSVSPLHRDLSVTILSDLAFLTFVLIALLIRLERKVSGGLGILLGTLVGFSIWIRYVGFFLILVTILDILRDREATSAEKVRCMKFFFLFLFLWLVPIGMVHSHFSENLFQTGYHFWLPHRWGHWGDAFSWKYAFMEPGFGGTQGNLSHYLKLLIGWNRGIFAQAYPFPVFVLALWAIPHILREGLSHQRKFLSFVFIFFSVFMVVFFPHFSQEDRFLIPVLSLVAILSGKGYCLFAQGMGKNKKIFLGAFVLFYSLTIALSNPTGYHLKRPFPKKDLVSLLNGIQEERSVVSGLDPVSFQYYFGRRPNLHYLPIANRVEYVKRFPEKGKSSTGRTLSRIEKGESLYVENYFSHFYKKEYKLLWRYCRVQKELKRGKVSLYRLSRLNHANPT